MTMGSDNRSYLPEPELLLWMLPLLKYKEREYIIGIEDVPIFTQYEKVEEVCWEFSSITADCNNLKKNIGWLVGSMLLLVFLSLKYIFKSCETVSYRNRVMTWCLSLKLMIKTLNVPVWKDCCPSAYHEVL